MDWMKNKSMANRLEIQLWILIAVCFILIQSTNQTPDSSENCEDTTTMAQEPEGHRDMCSYREEKSKKSVLLGSPMYPAWSQSTGCHCFIYVRPYSDVQVRILDFEGRNFQEEELCLHQLHLVKESVQSSKHHFKGRPLREQHFFYCANPDLEFEPYNISTSKQHTRLTVDYKRVKYHDEPVIMMLMIKSSTEFERIECFRKPREPNVHPPPTAVVTTADMMNTDINTTAAGHVDRTGASATKTSITTAAGVLADNNTVSTPVIQPNATPVVVHITNMGLNAVPFWWLGVIVILSMLLLITVGMLIQGRFKRSKRKDSHPLRTRARGVQVNSYIDIDDPWSLPGYALLDAYNQLNTYAQLHGYSSLQHLNGYERLHWPLYNDEGIYEHLGPYQHLRLPARPENDYSDLRAPYRRTVSDPGDYNLGSLPLAPPPPIPLAEYEEFTGTEEMVIDPYSWAGYLYPKPLAIHTYMTTIFKDPYGNKYLSLHIPIKPSSSAASSSSTDSNVQWADTDSMIEYEFYYPEIFHKRTSQSYKSVYLPDEGSEMDSAIDISSISMQPTGQAESDDKASKADTYISLPPRTANTTSHVRFMKSENVKKHSKKPPVPCEVFKKSETGTNRRKWSKVGFGYVQTSDNSINHDASNYMTPETEPGLMFRSTYIHTPVSYNPDNSKYLSLDVGRATVGDTGSGVHPHLSGQSSQDSGFVMGDDFYEYTESFRTHKSSVSDSHASSVESARSFSSTQGLLSKEQKS